MNSIKRFFTWLLQWVMIIAVFGLLAWGYDTFISDEDATTNKTEMTDDKKLIEVEKTYWDNGNLKSETSYKKHYSVGYKKVKTTLIPHGIAKDYYENGVLAKEDPYVDGNRTGVLNNYDEEGNLEASSEYLNNKEHGKVTYYNSDGSILGIEYYKHGEQIKVSLAPTNNDKVIKVNEEENKEKGLDALRAGMPYSEARKIIFNAGWQGHGSAVKDLFGQAKSLYFDNGWTEIESCAMSGGSPCRYEFRDINQKKLVVITMGECFNDEGEKCKLAITQWFFE